MGIFESQTQFEDVMGKLFDRIKHTPAIADALGATDMVVRFRYSDPQSVVTLGLHADGLDVAFDDAGKADVEMAQSADTAHQFWLGRLSTAKALATGQVRATGNVAKALKLLPAIKPAFELYPDVLRERHLEHLIPKDESTPSLGELSAWWKRVSRAASRVHGRARVDRRRLPTDTRPPARASRQEAPTHRASLPEDVAALRTEMLRRMLVVREFEERLAACWQQGELPTSAIHLSSGQEAVAVGICFALRADDVIATTHRGHGHMLAKGAPADRMMAEIFGKSSGLCGGKGGSMHVTDAAVGAIGANGIVGSSPLIATGAALSFAQRHEDRVAVAFIGDGATNQGMFHEAVNLAAVWRLPVLFVIENNGYGEFTAQAKSTRVARLADRAAAYGIEGRSIDGNDVDVVYATACDAVERIRAGEGPLLLECITYRQRGHMEGDLQEYREDAEVAAWNDKDPIPRMRERLQREDVIDAPKAESLASEAVRVIDAAMTFARDADEPALTQLTSDVFAPERAKLEHTASGPMIEVTGSEAINMALREEMERDDSVILLGEDVSYGGYMAVTKGLVEVFGRDRVRDTPISENAIVGSAVGAAMTGLRPVAEILFADFLTACMDPLVNQAAKLRYMSGGQYRIPLVVRTPCGVGLGMAAQHSQSLESLLMGIPGLIIAAPSSPRDCRGLLKSAIRSDNPVVFFEHKLLYLTEGEVPKNEELIPFGKARVVRQGNDVTVVGLLYSVQTALEAATLLDKEGISLEVIDPRTLAPLDMDTIITSLEKTRRLVTIEEGPLRHGWGAEVVARAAAAAHGVLTAPPIRLGGSDGPVPYNKRLEHASVPDAERLVQEIRTLL